MSIDDKPTAASARDAIVLPIAREVATIGKRTVEQGRIRVETKVETRHETLRDTLVHDVLDVQHVPVGRFVEGDAPVPRDEGDRLIVPIVEERLVVEKRLFLVEELHVRRRQEQSAVEVPVELRTTKPVVTREVLTETTEGVNG